MKTHPRWLARLLRPEIWFCFYSIQSESSAIMKSSQSGRFVVLAPTKTIAEAKALVEIRKAAKVRGEVQYRVRNMFPWE